MAAWQHTGELSDVNQIRIIVPPYGTKTTLQVPEVFETLHDVVLNSSLSEPPATFGIHDKSLYAFDDFEKEPCIRDA